MRTLMVVPLVLTLIVNSGMPVFAQGRPGGRPAQARPQAAPRPQPQARPQGGFNLSKDVPQGRPPGGNRPPGGSPPNGNRPPGGSPPNGNRPPGGGPPNGNRPPPGRPNYGNRPIIVNPVYRPGPAWGWNRGSAWYPASNYWGGGFWGSLAITAAAAAVFGSITASNNQTYSSYQVQPNSPGATLLNNYGLQQVPCGPPGIVIIYGPDNSVICANPNNLVAPGVYDLDTEQLSLVSR